VFLDPFDREPCARLVAGEGASARADQRRGVVNFSLTQNFLRKAEESGLVATTTIRGMGTKP
jgi:hypothetical protein